MNSHASYSTPVDPAEVDLSATRRRLLIAREQCASHLSTTHFRAAVVMRRWQSAHPPHVDHAD